MSPTIKKCTPPLSLLRKKPNQKEFAFAGIVLGEYGGDCFFRAGGRTESHPTYVTKTKSEVGEGGKDQNSRYPHERRKKGPRTFSAWKKSFFGVTLHDANFRKSDRPPIQGLLFFKLLIAPSCPYFFRGIQSLFSPSPLLQFRSIFLVHSNSSWKTDLPWKKRDIRPPFFRPRANPGLPS